MTCEQNLQQVMLRLFRAKHTASIVTLKLMDDHWLRK